ncbi:amidase family protein, partial [Paraburkholderia sp. SIMBA_061]
VALSVSRPEIQRRLNQAFVSKGAIAILQPTTPCTAPLIGEQEGLRIAGQEVSTLALANHTLLASSVGLPGTSLPAGLSRAGLPIGLELDAPLGSDRALLSLSRHIERILGTMPPTL